MKDEHNSRPDDLEIERLTCQMKALIRARWPERYGRAKPDLKVMPSHPKADINDLCNDRGVIERTNQLLRENLPEEFKREISAYEFARSENKVNSAVVTTRSTESSGVTRFPRARKRGAKVHTGRCARIIPLPGVFIGEDLDERFEFIRKYASDWQTDDPDGTDPVDWDRRNWIEAAFENRHNRPMTDHDKRKQVAEGRARIDTRNRIKAYLEHRGVDLDKVRNAEEALFALFGLVEVNP